MDAPLAEGPVVEAYPEEDPKVELLLEEAAVLGMTPRSRNACAV